MSQGDSGNSSSAYGATRMSPGPDLSGSESFYGVCLKQHSDVSVIDVSGGKNQNRFINLENQLHSLIVEIQLK